jgi:hypothetical protein
LHFLAVPGRKSLAELVRHLDEQLSMAILTESVSNEVVCPTEAATIQVTMISRILIADFLLLNLFVFLRTDGEYEW